MVAVTSGNRLDGKRMTFWEHEKSVLLKREQTQVGICKEIDLRILLNLLHEAVVGNVVEI
jgi:hypothetical protein